MKNNTYTLCKTLLTEGKCIRKEVINDTLYLTVSAFGHTYRIESPYTAKCKITQEN